MADDPFLDPKRGYPEITRLDTSITMRWKIQGFWGVGQQLWDVDMNNTFDQMSAWLPMTCDRYTYVGHPRPPYPPHDPQNPYEYPMSVAPGLIVYVGSSETVYRTPEVGATAFITSEFRYRVWTGVTWKTWLDARLHRNLSEISVFVSAAAPNAVLFSHVVDVPFELIPIFGSADDDREVFDPDATEYTNINRTSGWSNVRGLPSQSTNYWNGPPNVCSLYRNGVRVGIFSEDWSSDYHRLQYTPGLRFETGDVITAKFTRTASNLSFSIVGRRI